MNHRLWILVAAVGLLLTAGPAVAYAQDVLLVNTSFPFILGGKTHPAGEYQLSVSQDQMELSVAPAKGAKMGVLILTRLAGSDNPAQADRVVFDKVGNTYYLSEVWLAPGQDGFLIHATKEPHTHQAVKVGRKAK